MSKSRLLRLVTVLSIISFIATIAISGLWLKESKRNQNLKMVIAKIEEHSTILGQSLERKESKLNQSQTELSNKSARISNLEAQISSLRANQNEIKAELAQEIKAKDAITKENTLLKKRLIQATELAPSLELEVKNLRQNFDSLKTENENLIDQISLMPHHLIYRLKGKSNNLIALESTGGELFQEGTYYLIRQNEILAQAEIQKEKDGLIFARIKDWIKSPSTLVKGENLFIVRVY